MMITEPPFDEAELSGREEPLVEQGEWSEISNITTKDNQMFDQSPCAALITKGKKKWLNIERAGTMLTQYGYSFGDHLWELKISYI
jgi:hypothetical protein